MRQRIVVVVLAAVFLATGATYLNSSKPYRVEVLLGAATNLVKGGTVEVNGFKAGRITSIAAKDGKALVGLELKHDYAPLHDGAVVNIGWKALLGERIVQITDGPRDHAEVPSGGMLTGQQSQPVELDTLLNALDPATRQHLVSLVNQLQQSVANPADQKNLNDTLQSAGPALQALGGLLRAVGTDGPAIKNLVTRLDAMVTTLAQHDGDVRKMVDDLNNLTATAAKQKDSLDAALTQLPSSLQNAQSTLDKVGPAVDAASPLLSDLQTATASLPAAARDLRPVLTALHPASAKLKTTLDAAAQFLTFSPGLLDAANTTVPKLQTTLDYLQPVLGFLRPYTPEAVGVVSTWASAFSNYDSNGHYARIFIQAGGSSLNANPGVMPPGTQSQPTPAPGANVNQPWTDAFGSTPR